MYGVKQLPFSYQVIWEKKEKEGKLRKAQSKIQRTQLLKLKILQKKPIAEYLKQKNESISWKVKWWK